MEPMLDRDNIALISVRKAPPTSQCNYFLCCRGITTNGAIRSDNQSIDTVFPLFVEGGLSSKSEANFDWRVIASASSLALSNFNEQPSQLFHYLYAVTYSPTYRTRYAGFLKVDFPRIPITSDEVLLNKLARLGGELTELHLLESPKLDQHITEFIGGRSPEVEKVSWSRSTVWLDKAETTGFRGVREEVWNFHVGGYQVCEKWLKDRRGRTLTKNDLATYQKIIVALTETIRLMKEIDKAIEKHGGWPTAFANASRNLGPETVVPPAAPAAAQPDLGLQTEDELPLG